MKTDYEFAITLAKVTGFGSLVQCALDQDDLPQVRELLKIELAAYEHATELIKKVESPTFINFFKYWLPDRLMKTREALEKVEGELNAKKD